MSILCNQYVLSIYTNYAVIDYKGVAGEHSRRLTRTYLSKPLVDLYIETRGVGSTPEMYGEIGSNATKASRRPSRLDYVERLCRKHCAVNWAIDVLMAMESHRPADFAEMRSFVEPLASMSLRDRVTYHQVIGMIREQLVFNPFIVNGYRIDCSRNTELNLVHPSRDYFRVDGTDGDFHEM